MKKLTRKQFFTTGILLSMLILIVWSFTFSMTFPGDQPQPDGNHGAVHIVFNIFAICLFLVGIITNIVNLVNYDLDFFENCYREEKYPSEDDNMKPIKFKKWLMWGLIIILFFFIGGLTKNIFKDSVKLYNGSKKYNNLYIQKVQEKKGFYDKLWKTYLQKEKITNVNKETFITVTKIIMENRKDGLNVTWKWLQENQQIPYDDFVKFYEDLSNFITKQREGYFNIEIQCQEIANQNNTMLDTFPNNIYNKVLNLNRINFEYGFTSDSTENVFKTKKENI